MVLEVREVEENKGRKVCMDCKWVKYVGGGIWICTRERVGRVFGVMEVHPLQLGCDRWEFKGKEGK
jgi:hypothetical protein